MVDFSQLLKRPAGTHKRPPALPAGNYPAIISNYETGDRNKNRTPYVQFNVKLTDWPDTVPEDERTAPGEDGAVAPIDLSKRSYRKQFYLTDDAIWRLDDFLVSMGMPNDGSVTYQDFLPPLPGTPVLAEIIQNMTDGGDIVNNLNALKPLE